MASSSSRHGSRGRGRQRAAEAWFSSERLQWLVEGGVNAGVGRQGRKVLLAGAAPRQLISEAAACLGEAVLLAAKGICREGGGAGHHGSQNGGKKRRGKKENEQKWKQLGKLFLECAS